MEIKLEAEKDVPDFCISFHESALRVASTGGKKSLKN